MTITTTNPATTQVIETYQEMTLEEVNSFLNTMQDKQRLWAKLSFEERATYMHKLADFIEHYQDDLASLITLEMGKVISAAKAEIKKSQWVCRHYAEQAANYLEEQHITTTLQKSYVTYQPLGTIFAIMPWNYPFWQVFRCLAPNLMAGNACLLSHAPISTGAALKIEDLVREAGFPEGLFKVVVGDVALSHDIIRDSRVSAVTLTGSENAGRKVAQAAGHALKKVVLELGGSDPYIILSDADLELAAEQIIKSRMNNSGQVCISAKRIIAVSSIYSELTALLTKKISGYEIGDPMDPQTKLGPLAREDLRNTVHSQVQNSIQCGAELIVGGYLPERTGWYYPATLLGDVKPGMPAFDDEIFGPVVSVCQASDEDEAITLANHSRFGLSAVVFTANREKGERIAKEDIQVGTCYVNGLVSSDPNLPFGGIKASGFGRELGAEGIKEFVNIKTIGVVG